MRIEEIDANFKLNAVKEPDVVWHSVKDVPFRTYGILYSEEEECYRRVPKEVTQQIQNPLIEWISHTTAGGRVRFTTDARYVAVRCVAAPGGLVSHMPATGSVGFSLTNEENVFFGRVSPEVASVTADAPFAFEGKILTDSKRHTYTLHFPLYHGVKAVFIGLPDGAELSAPTHYTHERPVVFYGSSITQGGCASRPDNCYTGLLCEWCDTDILNLGFSGNAKGEIPMAEFIAETDPSVFVFDYDYNAPTPEHLAATHEPFFRAFRAKRPDTPVIILSRPNYNPANKYHCEQRRIIEETYENAVAAGDKNVYIIPAEALFGENDRQHCTVDRVHPNDLGFYRMAKAVYPILSKILG